MLVGERASRPRDINRVQIAWERAIHILSVGRENIRRHRTAGRVFGRVLWRLLLQNRRRKPGAPSLKEEISRSRETAKFQVANTSWADRIFAERRELHPPRHVEGNFIGLPKSRELGGTPSGSPRKLQFSKDFRVPWGLFSQSSDRNGE